MKKRRTPQEKKRLHYTKDHMVLAEYPHRFRKRWPKKKAQVNQAYRHAVRQALIATRHALDPENAQSSSQAIPRKPLQKWGVVSLRERVEIKRAVRRSRLGWNFFRQPYSSHRDRTRFSVFLEALTAKQSDESIHHARVIAGWLAPVSDQPGWLKLEETHQWLRAFFKDEPGWEMRLRNWIMSQTSRTAKS